MTEIRLVPKGDDYMLVHKDSGKPFLAEFLQPKKGSLIPVKHPLGISSEEKKMLDRYGNLVIAQNQWQIFKIDGEYVIDRY